MNEISNIKPIIYDIFKLLSSSNDCAIDATQNLGVSLTNSVKKEGVNIIQIQNVKSESVIPKLIDVLQILDQVDTAPKMIPHQDAEVIQIEASDNPIDNMAQYIIDNKINVKRISDILKIRVYDLLVTDLTQENALKEMGITRGAISQIRKRLRNNPITKGDTVESIE